MQLHISALSVALGGETILPDLSLQAEEGEFLSLLGPSGCGKSTLLKTIAGIHPVSSGRILLGGEDITALPPHKRGTVIVFQDMRLFPHMTVAENVAYPRKMQGLGRAARMQEASAHLRMVQLEGFEGRRVSTLSGGQQQRVALARALCARPKLLLLDEPFSSLDENLRDEMRLLVRKLHDETRMTTVLVTHDRQEALSLSDKLALMLNGQILQLGSPQEVYEAPASRAVADYFGDHAYLDGVVQNGLFHAGSFSCPAPQPDGAYSLLLRPAMLRPEKEGPLSLRLLRQLYRGSDSLGVWEVPGGSSLKIAVQAPLCGPGQSQNWALCTDKLILFPR